MTHTPEPWFMGKADVGPDFLVYARTPNGPLYIAEVYGYQAPHTPHGPSEANARLIATAPKLLKALEVIAGIGQYSNYDLAQAIRIAKLVIKLAKGLS